MTWEDLYTFITGIMLEQLALIDAYTANSQSATPQKSKQQHSGHMHSTSKMARNHLTATANGRVLVAATRDTTKCPAKSSSTQQLLSQELGNKLD